MFDLTSYGEGAGSSACSPPGPPPPHTCRGCLRQPWVLVWILREEEEETATRFLKVEGHERMRIVVGIDVFEAEALGLYL